LRLGLRGDEDFRGKALKLEARAPFALLARADFDLLFDAGKPRILDAHAPASGSQR
jgi:hypothetical protein